MSNSPQSAASHDKLLIVDFGSQVTQLIARRVREAGVYCEIVPFQSAGRAFAEMKPKAVILSGGPASVPDVGSPRAPQAIFDSGVPVLGICYGQMTMAARRLGRERPSPRVRPGGSDGRRVEPAAGRALETGRTPRRLDEPRRPHHQTAAGIHPDRDL
jgi:GMP synthase (glutamine-hydrolysing)